VASGGWAIHKANMSYRIQGAIPDASGGSILAIGLLSILTNIA
jgi:hypothetical protein